MSEPARPRRRKKRRAADASGGGVSPRALVGVAGSALVLGAALTAVGDLTFGPLLDLFALVAAVYAAHRVGRMGPDPGTIGDIPLDAEPLRGQNLRRDGDGAHGGARTGTGNR